MARIRSERVSVLNDSAPNADGQYLLYWMQHAQRAVKNPALELAAARANRLKCPLLVLFVVDSSYPDANARHFSFMLEGLADAARTVATRGAHFSLRLGNPCQIVAEMARNATMVVMDRAYLRPLRAWRAEIAQSVDRRIEMVEGEVVVPVEHASPKLETAARTIRPKIHRTMDAFLEEAPLVPLDVRAKGLGHEDDVDLSEPATLLARLDCDHSVPPVATFKGGHTAARARLDHFINATLPRYADGRSDIVERHVSHLSPYLHFGQISPLEIYHAVHGADGGGENAKGFLEEMIVRRELAVNFVYRNPDYDRWEAIPAWARASLEAHRGDPREALYTHEELEAGKTLDPYWNAAMREMRITGYLHNHLRMYWGKRVLGWMADPAEAHRTLIALNNKYFLDGRDANTYANVAWIFGVHDRGWPEREVYGKVRTMKPSGLERKFDIKAYVRWAKSL